MISKILNLKPVQISSWHELQQKIAPSLPKWIFILFIVLIAKTLAQLTWLIFSPAEQQAATIESITSKKTVHSFVPSTSLKDVALYHLFGEANKTVPVQQAMINAPETRLKLELKGVFATSNSVSALAIISSSKQQDKTYHIGDKISGGAELHAVYSDRVILKRNGQLETLRLPKSKLDNKAVIHTVPKANNTSDVVDETRYSQSNTASPAEKLRSMRDTLLKEPEKIWQQVRINPVMQNGEVQGYTLIHDDQGVMAAMKLQNTDIITHVNGLSLSDPATLYALMNTLSEEQSFELTVLRNGQEQNIQLNF